MASPVRTDSKPCVAVVGSGLMGCGIALAFASSGFRVALCGRNIERSRAGVGRVRTIVERLKARGRVDAEHAAAYCDNVVPGEIDRSALDGCSLAIEAVPEVRETKNSVLRDIEDVLGAEAILASTTSGLPITGLAARLRRPGRFVGLHFFSPAERMPLVEVVRGEATSQETVDTACDLVRNAQKAPVIVRDGPGFLATRMFAAYLDEGVAMVVEGVDPDAVDRAAVLAGRAIGPLAMLDETGIELNLQQARQAAEDGAPERFRRPLSRETLAALVAAGRCGRNRGGGFYDWPQDGAARTVWPGLAGLFPPARVQPVSESIRLRLLAAEAREALRCMEEGVVTSADDVDAASVLGLGFDKKVGGILRWVESFGPAAFRTLCCNLAGAHGERFAVSPWLEDVARDADLSRLRGRGRSR